MRSASAPALATCLLGLSTLAQAAPFQMLTEVDPQVQPPDFDFITQRTYTSLADLESLSSSSTGNIGTGQNISGSAWSIKGLARDGSQWFMITECDSNPLAAGACEHRIQLRTFDSRADLLDLDPSDTMLLGDGQNISGNAWSVAGLTYDGSQFVMLTECDPDPVAAGACEHRISLRTFASLADLKSLTVSSFMQIGNNQQISGNAWSIRGLAWDGTQYLMLTECDADQFSACQDRIALRTFSTLGKLEALMPDTFGLIGDANNIGGRAYSISAFEAFPDPDGTIPEPSAVVLLLMGGTALVRGRRRGAESGDTPSRTTTEF